MAGDVIRYAFLAAASIVALGCATPYAKVDGLLVDARPAPVVPAAEIPRVTVIHGGTPRVAAVQQSVVNGDRVVTAPRASAILTVQPGYEVIVEPGTDVRIEDRSMVVQIGRLILKRLKKTKQKLQVRSEFASAGVEGTHFVFEVLPDAQVHIATLDGVVRVTPRQGTWPAVTYRAGDEGFIRRGAPPERVRPIDRRAAQLILDRTVAVETAVQYKAGQPWSRFRPLWQKPAFFVPAAAATAAAVILVVSKGKPAVPNSGNPGTIP